MQKLINDEVWKLLVEFDNLYEISNYGRLRSVRKNKILKPTNRKDGYKLCIMSIKGKVSYRYIHRLVAYAFLQKIENKPSVNHIDGNKENNHVSNLEFCTTKENNEHAGKLNLKPFGTKHPNSKLTKEDLNQIQILLKEKNLSHLKIAKIFKVSQSTISNFAKQKTYFKEVLNEK